MTRSAPLHCDEIGRDRIGGFALIEVMLALMLIAVLAALALPGLARPTGAAALRVAAFQVSALLREDRNFAQGAGRAVVVRVEGGGRRVMSGASSASVALPTRATARVVDVAVPEIRFSPDGRSSGGALLIESDTARYVVVVSRDTGAIRVGEP